MGERIEKWTIEMIKQGVSEQHIDNMKRKRLRSICPYVCYYDKEKEGKFLTLVDIKKIIGINTGWITAGRTVYNLFFSVTGEISDSEIESLHYNRIKENIDSLISNGISYQHHFYVDKSRENILRDGLPKLQYFQDDDIYFSGATHRTISAMMFNAPKIIGYVTTYKKNETKFANFQIYKQVQHKWNHLIDIELKYVELISDSYNEYITLKIKDFPQLKLIKFQDPIIEAEDLDFDNTNKIELFKEKTNELIYKIKEIDEVYSKKLKLILKIPLVFSLLKTFKCYFFYSILYEFRYQKDPYLNIDQPIDEIINGIKKKLFLDIINENKPIKRNYERY
ncbi:hypothetical protein [Vallitalea guaymasensis]|uniref:Uncharacterized protein n=1 Tax=Vallitalea guaymasensis TaxID=1185412 RepID=A0A8J8SDT0_9FIRM|nr:hypothetical protein [Vallitalea guaymasensis]QUH31147.1 hypothetical protein HYG85_20365 [Vallitalea guaymasensis]